MKDSLLLPVIFLGLLVACFILFTVGYLMFLWDTQYTAAASPTLAWALKAAPEAGRTVFVPATLAAFFLLMVRVARKPGVPLLSFFLPLLVLSACLYFGIKGAERLPVSPEGAIHRLYNPLVPDHFNPVERAVIYPQKADGGVLGPTLIVDPEATPAFSYESSGSFDQKGWSAVFPGGKLTVPLRPRNPIFSTELAPRSFLGSLIGEMASLERYLQQESGRSLIEFAMALGGVVLFSVGCIGFSWLTRWPLMNVFLIAVCFRGLFWLYSLFTTTVAEDAFALVVPKRFLIVAPSLGLAALGVIFLLWNIFFIRRTLRD